MSSHINDRCYDTENASQDQRERSGSVRPDTGLVVNVGCVARLLLIAHGTVIAGVDLETLDPENVEAMDDEAVTVLLPASEILVAALDCYDASVRPGTGLALAR